MPHHGVGVTAIVNVADHHPGIGFGNADVGQQRLTVLHPNTGDHGPRRAGAVVDGDALNQSPRAAPDVHGPRQNI